MLCLIPHLVSVIRSLRGEGVGGAQRQPLHIYKEDMLLLLPPEIDDGVSPRAGRE